jgi:uncharacterized membrane protein YgdD (TMEM256/DUF423 family)
VRARPGDALPLRQIIFMERKIISTAAALGLTAVILGAFGAHALKQVLDAAQLQSFETGVRYQMYHAFLLLSVAVVPGIGVKTKKWIYNLTLAGVILFSGSIYLLSTMPVTGLDFKLIGPVTPLGGLLLMAAWFLLFVDFARQKR